MESVDSESGGAAKQFMATAVKASSAVPVLFSPITLKNRAGECGWQQSSWAKEAFAGKDKSSRSYNVAANMMALENRENHPYMHLFDGGLADNLGLRSMLDGALRHDGILKALDAMNMKETRRGIVILVNAETALDVASSRKMQTPSFTASLSAATSAPLQLYSATALKPSLWSRTACKYGNNSLMKMSVVPTHHHLRTLLAKSAKVWPSTLSK